MQEAVASRGVTRLCVEDESESEMYDVEDEMATKIEPSELWVLDPFEL